MRNWKEFLLVEGECIPIHNQQGDLKVLIALTHWLVPVAWSVVLLSVILILRQNIMSNHTNCTNLCCERNKEVLRCEPFQSKSINKSSWVPQQHSVCPYNPIHSSGGYAAFASKVNLISGCDCQDQFAQMNVVVGPNI